MGGRPWCPSYKYMYMVSNRKQSQCWPWNQDYGISDNITKCFLMRDIKGCKKNLGVYFFDEIIEKKGPQYDIRREVCVYMTKQNG